MKSVIVPSFSTSTAERLTFGELDGDDGHGVGDDDAAVVGHAQDLEGLGVAGAEEEALIQAAGMRG